MKKIFLLKTIFVLLLINNAFSQLKIVKDNIACTYGLKNEQGNWVLEPTYILIEDLQNGYFKTLTEGGKGVFYQTKHIIPNEYEEIVNEQNNFKVWKNNLVGILSHKGEIIVPVEFQSLLMDMNLFIRYKVIDNKYSFTCISITGNVLIPETKGIIKPFLGKAYTLIGDQHFEYSSLGNAGLIGIDGKMIIPRIYDRLRLCNEELTFVKDSKVGVINLKNEVILEGKPFLTPLAYDNYNELPCIQSDAIYKFFENGKYGIMKGNGEILHAATIDSIGRSFHDISNEKTTYIYKSNGKYGFISQDGEITTQAIYEQITPKPRLNWENDYLKKKKLFFLVLKNNRFGLVDDEGKEQIPCEFNRFYRLDYAKKPNYAISKLNEVFYLDFEKDTLKLQKMSLINEGKIIDLYTLKKEYFAFEVSKFEHGKNIISGLLPLYIIGKFIFVTRENKNHLYTLDGKPWNHYNNCYVNFQQGKYALIQTKINSQGLLNVYTGKIILDTNYTEIMQHFVADNLLWVKIQVGEEKVKREKNEYNQYGVIFNPTIQQQDDYFTMPKYKWIPFDTLGNKLTKSTFDKYFGNYDTQIILENGFYGVLEKNFKWLISPQFKAILKFSSTSYLVQSKGEKYGLLDINKGFIVDTVYDELETVYRGKLSETDFENTIGAMQYDKENWVKFGNSESHFLFSSLGEKIDQNHPQYKTKLLQFALLANSNYDSKAFKINVNQSDFSYFLKNTEKPIFTDFQLAIYNHFKQLFDLDHSCNFLDQSPCFQKKIYEIVEIGQKFVSAKNRHYVEHLNDFERLNDMMPYQNNYTIDFQNLIWNGNQLVNVSLDSIFGKGNLFEKELIDAIKKRDDLKLDCSSIDLLVDNFNDIFWLSEKGVHLQYDKSRNGYQEIDLVIPIENLRKHKESSWLLEYLK